MFACCRAQEAGEFDVVGSDSFLSEKLSDGQEAPCEYELKLKRGAKDGNWGMSVLVVPNVEVVVTDVRAGGSGVVPNHNKRAPPAERISVYDRIVRANDAETADAISTTLISERDVTLAMRRPRTFEQTIDANGKPLGMTLRYLENGAGLFVHGIAKDALVGGSGVDIACGDRIMKVNGRSGKLSDMLLELTSIGPVVLTIARA